MKIIKNSFFIILISGITLIFSINYHFNEIVFLKNGANSQNQNDNLQFFKITKITLPYFRDRDVETKNIHLYDLKNDPLEEKNIFKEKPDVTKSMELKLNKILNEEKIIFEKSENTITDDEREQAITKLRKLGYI